jgi:hypothetical protein
MGDMSQCRLHQFSDLLRMNKFLLGMAFRLGGRFRFRNSGLERSLVLAVLVIRFLLGRQTQLHRGCIHQD